MKMREWKMRLKYRIRTFFDFMNFAFYPKTALLLILAFTIVLDAIFAFALGNVPIGCKIYDIILALLTGITASAIVSIIIELSNNYKQNLLAWHELGEYYHTVSAFSDMKEALLGNIPTKIAKKKASEDFIAKGGVIVEDDENEEDESCDRIQATWRQIPEIMPVFLKTQNEKKAFLTEKELNSISIICGSYSFIREATKRMLSYDSLYNTLNHPDQDYLYSVFPRNVIDDMPEWMVKFVVSRESSASIERLADIILADSFLLNRVFRECDISEHSLEVLEKSQTKDSHIENDAMSETDDNSDDDEFADEGTFKERVNATDEYLRASQVPFLSQMISKYCSDICDELDKLLTDIKQKPYYGLMVRCEKKIEKSPQSSPFYRIAYEKEMDRLNGLANSQ